MFSSVGDQDSLLSEAFSWTIRWRRQKFSFAKRSRFEPRDSRVKQLHARVPGTRHVFLSLAGSQVPKQRPGAARLETPLLRLNYRA